MSTEVATLAERELALSQSALAGINPDDLQVPRLKVMQALSREVTEGDAAVGELVNSITGEVYGESVKLLVVDRYSGRFYAPRDGDTSYTAGKGVTVMPDYWDHPCAGKPFVDCPDAEETFVQRANDGDIPWGQGPPIQTTYDFVCLRIDDDGEIDNFPIRVPLKAGSAKEAKKWITLLAMRRVIWERVFQLETYKAVGKKSGKPFTGVRITDAGAATDDQRLKSVEWAQLIQSTPDAVTYDEDAEESGEKGAKPDAKGGIEV